LDALEDLGTLAEIVGDVVLERRSDALDDDETRWRLEHALERSQSRERAKAVPFTQRTANARLRGGEHRILIYQQY
jgi:hypothetical protein